MRLLMLEERDERREFASKLVMGSLLMRQTQQVVCTCAIVCLSSVIMSVMSANRDQYHTKEQ